MSDNYDNLISEAFDEFADRAAPAITAAGSQAVRATVIHRRRIRITTLSLLGALLIAVPVVTFAGDPRGNNGPPDIAASGATPSEEPAPSTESSTTPSTEPSASQYASSTPDGRMTADDLRDQPMLGCPQKPKIGMPVHTNLDDDPALETAVALVCGVSDPGPVKLMAYDRDATGAIVVLGQIIHDAARVDIIRNLTARTARTAGGVRAEVCILCGSDPDPDRWQIREYAWVGGKFAQVGGPTAPPVDKFAQLGFTVTDGEFKADDNGRNHKNYSLVITNTGTATSARFQLKALYDNPGDEWKLTGADWVGDSATAWHEGLAAGGSFTIVVNYSWPAAWAFTGSYFQLVGDNGPLTGQVVFNGGRT